MIHSMNQWLDINMDGQPIGNSRTVDRFLEYRVQPPVGAVPLGGYDVGR